MNSCKVFVPSGMLGTGMLKEAFASGIQKKPDIISCDAGSTDSGPYYLGTGTSKYVKEALKEDMRSMMVAAKQLAIPITVGSCGMCGTDSGVDALASLCMEICAEEHLRFTIAKIYTQQNAETLLQKYQQGQIHPLEIAPKITEEAFKECSHIVALAGVEPFITALKAGAEIILCGRATDTAIIAAMPIMKGCNVAAAWHGAKIAECGDLCTTDPSSGGVVLTFDEHGFTIEPAKDDNACTVYSVSAHMLYENVDPFRLTEPSGILNVTNAVYTQIDEKRVRVTGAAFTYASRYTMKLEGAARTGYQTISIVGIQDKRIMNDPTCWLRSLSGFAKDRLERLGLSEGYSFALKPYGWNAISDETIEAGTYTPREIGLMLVTTAKTQELATKVAKIFNPLLLHFPPNRNEPLPAFAFPFSPPEIEKGPIYEFRLNHVVEVEYPLELVRITYVQVGKKEEASCSYIQPRKKKKAEC
jgi:Acyclic terpene utilisation family protein AtuA